MNRQLRTDGIYVRRIERFQCLCHPAMQIGPLHGADLTIRHVADAVMAEVIGLTTTGTHDTTLPQFIQRIDHSPFGIHTYCAQQWEGKRTPNHGGNTGDLVGFR